MPKITSTHVEVFPFRRTPTGLEFLLLLRRPDSAIGGTWQPVFGAIEAGETAPQAALRELREETSLFPRGFWQVEGVDIFYLARIDTITLCPCFAVEVAADAPVTISDEHTAFRWLDTAAMLRETLWPGQRRAVREIVTDITRPGPAEPLLRIPLNQERSAPDAR